MTTEQPCMKKNISRECFVSLATFTFTITLYPNGARWLVVAFPTERVDWLLLSQWSALIGCCAAHARICTCACVLVVGDSVDWNTGTRCVHGNQPKCQHYYCHVFNVYFLFYFFVNIIFFSFYILGLGFISIGVICHFLSGLSPLLAYYMGCEIFRKRDLKDFKRSKVQQVL